jgi:hypothetical protein
VDCASSAGFQRAPAVHRNTEAATWTCVVIYERPMTDRSHRIRQVVEAPAPRWTFEAGMRETTCEALAIL